MHRYQETEPLAVPSSLSLDRTERIRDAPLQPATLHSLFHKMVIYCDPSAPLDLIAGQMHKQIISQVPIYEGKNFVGLLSTTSAT